jgi:branched-chain amino acid transport system permease protein
MPLLQLALNGIALGAAYALVALGFVLVVNATGAVNFAHGDLVMAGGYAAVLLGAWLHAPLLVLLPLVAGVMFVLGVAVCFLAYFPLLDRPPSTVFISTLLCGIILENAYIVIFGPQAKAGPPLLAGGTIEIGTVLLSRQAVATIVVATVLVGVQYLVFFRTQIGRRLRAVSQDREMAQALGIRSLALIAITFGVGTALAGIAGAILANQFFVSPGGGVPLSVYGYIAVVIGGWGSVFGAVVGALIIALFQTVASAFVPYTVATGGLYVALLVTLFLRPQGIFGERVQRRV